VISFVSFVVKNKTFNHKGSQSKALSNTKVKCYKNDWFKSKAIKFL